MNIGSAHPPGYYYSPDYQLSRNPFYQNFTRPPKPAPEAPSEPSLEIKQPQTSLENLIKRFCRLIENYRHWQGEYEKRCCPVTTIDKEGRVQVIGIRYDMYEPQKLFGAAKWELSDFLKKYYLFGDFVEPLLKEENMDFGSMASWVHRRTTTFYVHVIQETGEEIVRDLTKEYSLPS